MYFFTLLFVLILAAMSSVMGLDCRWNKDTEYPSNHPPLLMDVQTWRSIVPIMEGTERIVNVAEGAAIVIACPETTIGEFNKEVVAAKCVGGTILNAEGKDVALSELGCSSPPKEGIKKSLGPCGEGGEFHAIGFEVIGYDFYELVRVCFDPIEENNLYSTHTIRGAHIGAKDVNPDRPGFKSDKGFYTVSASTCYQQASQELLMKDILGDSSVIDVDANLYFARGHMAPDADFVTEQEEDATYYFINAAPQWQTFNNGNWKDLETDVRNLAESRGRDLTVWSGTWNVLQLDDTNNNPVNIYLGLTEGQNVIPAPDINWKVVYDASTDEGAAVVGVNNPYLSSFPATVCGSASDCSQYSTWLSIETGDLISGATYCCTVQELKAVVPNAPDLATASVLA